MILPSPSSKPQIDGGKHTCKSGKGIVIDNEAKRERERQVKIKDQPIDETLV